jgi:hypothetical protein
LPTSAYAAMIGKNYAEEPEEEWQHHESEW